MSSGSKTKVQAMVHQLARTYKAVIREGRRTIKCFTTTQPQQETNPQHKDASEGLKIA